tara:strand:+ start:491 stop:1204 length:714 start_codon:yes stop_codon:yes gene_type:complete
MSNFQNLANSHLSTIKSKITTLATDINSGQVSNHTLTHTKLDNLVVHLPTNKVSVFSTSGVAAFADTSPAPTTDTDNNRSGWLHKKLTGTEKLNYYFYSQGSKAKTLADLTSVCANVMLDTWDNTTSCPFFVVYTKPTGVGDAGVWFHSSIVYGCDANIDIALGEHIQLWAKTEPTINTGLRQIELSTEIITGPALSTEEILTISIHTDSGSAVNTQSVISNLGWEINSIKMRLELC